MAPRQNGHNKAKAEVGRLPKGPPYRLKTDSVHHPRMQGFNDVAKRMASEGLEETRWPVTTRAVDQQRHLQGVDLAHGHLAERTSRAGRLGHLDAAGDPDIELPCLPAIVDGQLVAGRTE